ncbi:flagellar hook-associated protein FlgK [Massilia solisilvae]|uniref:Flagellar hook-associated protein 1 n=1 Tax=Massilia solisilvae TaxID=1811225 RepID=A0ABT2BET8_9BURK|nr:flagellar hook-associated protein FlgK [Massilia solisilvae]MCS0607031.1 flagellar hook-associated protein FlgK [Massilia solisilvae]
MAGDILSIGKSALFAAQAGLSTTGHNIANANVAGYSRQVVVQSTTVPVDMGVGFFGTGTQVAQIKRFSDSFLDTQVRSSQTAKSAFDAFNAQISQLDNLLADSSAGLSPALQSFFKRVQDVAGNQGSVQSRQSMLSGAQTLAGRFQAMDGRLQEIREGINSQITANVTVINSYAQQIADLNDQITGVSSDGQHLPNDLLDKRDQLVRELNQHVKAEVSQGDGYSLTVSIGNGMPLVVGKQSYKLAATTSPTDQARTEVGLETANGKVTVLGESTLQGGELGGLLDFRSNVLDKTQNELGKVAAGLAFTFNAQHKLGVDENGLPGGDFFTLAKPVTTSNIYNNMLSSAKVDATITDPAALTGSDYRVDYDGANFMVTRLSDNKKTAISPFPQTKPQTIDGVDFAVSGSASAGDNFLVRPTINGASGFAVALTDTSQIAAAAPILAQAPVANTGTATISKGSIDASFLSAAPTLPMTLTYDAASGSLTGWDPTKPVTVTVNGVAQPPIGPAVPPATTLAVPYQTAGATYSQNGMTFTISAGAKDKDTFVVSVNTATGDVRNANLLGNLQSTNIFDGKNATYQSSYAKLVSFVGNKARESQVNGQAADAMLSQATAAAQSVSGVNLDEEATNLLRYQQAYQAAGKVMQIASTVFDSLLSIGH